MQLIHKKFLVGVVVFLAVIWVSQIFAVPLQSAPLEVNFLDVGQGDAILVNYLGQYQILIDGGPDGKKLLNQLGKVMNPDDRRIDLAILTHPDSDHMAGLIDLLENYQVGLFLDSGQETDSDIFKQFSRILDEKSIRRESVLEGSSLNIGEYLKLNFYNPDQMSVEKETNDNSVVTRMDWGENSFLFLGDCSGKIEYDMIKDEEDLDVDWLKVAHHGSKNSAMVDFLKAVSPQKAIISAGKGNRYGHPHQETIDRLNEVGAEIIRTDERGTISVVCFGLNQDCQLK